MKGTQTEDVGTSKAREGNVRVSPVTANSPDLEIKDAQLIFGAIWRELEREFGRTQMRFPRELILLGGAPGAGKGTNSDFIRKVRGITAPPIVISQLLETPEARAIKARGAMVGIGRWSASFGASCSSLSNRTALYWMDFPARKCRWSA